MVQTGSGSKELVSFSVKHKEKKRKCRVGFLEYLDWCCLGSSAQQDFLPDSFFRSLNYFWMKPTIFLTSLWH